MDAFPAFFPLAGRTVAIAGEGEQAEAKLRLFEGSPAVIRRLSGAAALDPEAYADATLAFVAGGDEAWARGAVEAARSAGLPVNAVDRPALCDFTTPAVIDRGEVVAAIGTGGASPMLATMLRHDIEARVPEGAGRVAALFRTMQEEVRAALPDFPRRRAFLRAALTGPASDAAMAGDMARARDLLRRALSSDAPATGVVLYIDARGPADLLTLRAARALSTCDVLVCDPDASPEVLALARREAERLPLQDIGQLARFTAAGQRVGRLITQSAWRTEVAELAAAGVETQVLPIAS